jgi:hypothetical protein
MERIRPAWPGLRRLPGAADASLTYGMVPPGLFVTIRERFFAGRQFLNARRVPRTSAHPD